MILLFNAAALVMVFCAGSIVIIMAAMAVSQRGRTIKKLSCAACLLGASVLAASCSTIGSSSGSTSAKQHGVQRYSAQKPVGHVKRAAFTTAIENREPTNNISQLHNDRQKIYYFTDIRGMQGQTVSHHWIYKGKVRAEVEFKVKGPRWRVYSSKRLERNWLGDWTVVTVDQQGRTLSRDRFTYAEVPGFFEKSGELYDDLLLEE